MDDAGVRRHGLEVVERVLAPLQKAVALLVALELELAVDSERVFGAVLVDLHGVVDHELHRLERIDFLRVATERLHRVAHRREIHDRRNTREILQQNAAGRERDFLVRLGLGLPIRERHDVFFANRNAVLGSQQALEQNL